MESDTFKKVLESLRQVSVPFFEHEVFEGGVAGGMKLERSDFERIGPANTKQYVMLLPVNA